MSWQRDSQAASCLFLYRGAALTSPLGPYRLGSPPCFLWGPGQGRAGGTNAGQSVRPVCGAAGVDPVARLLPVTCHRASEAQPHPVTRPRLGLCQPGGLHGSEPGTLVVAAPCGPRQDLGSSPAAAWLAGLPGRGLRRQPQPGDVGDASGSQPLCAALVSPSRRGRRRRRFPR